MPAVANMGIVIKPFTEEYLPAVKAFNERLRAGGAALVFPESHVSVLLPKIDGREIYDEYFLAVEDGTVRGAYILKRQPFYVGGRVLPLAQFRLPISEGHVDKRFASVGVQLYLDAVRRMPQLFTIGLGGDQEAVSQMLVKAGWNTSLVPFYFRVLQPAKFLRNIAYLRTTRWRRIVLDVLAATGLGTFAVHAYQALKTRGMPRETTPVECTVEPAFGPWADEIWHAARSESSLIAVRDATILNILYPADEPRWKRLRISFESRIVGWAVVLNVPMQGHNYFGDMQVGSLIDCMALPGMEHKVTSAVMHYMQQTVADIVVTNLSHHSWRPALEAAGFYQGPSNYIFAASKNVAAMLDPFDKKKESVHMTRGDGAGAENLITVRK